VCEAAAGEKALEWQQGCLGLVAGSSSSLKIRKPRFGEIKGMPVLGKKNSDSIYTKENR